MRKLPKDKILPYLCLVIVLALFTPLLHRIPRNRGRKWYWHVVFVLLTTVSLIWIPAHVQNEMFSPGGVLLLATLLPVYESVVAACSIGVADDTAWLQFWITSSILSFSTEFIDNIRQVLPAAGEHWYEFEFFFHLWLILPVTDGAAFIYDVFTKPYLAPIGRKISASCEGYIGLLMTIINTSYIWMVWFTFMSLPEEARRFVVVALGTVYPIAASITAIAIMDETKNDNSSIPHWLTYWASFSLLFISMDYLENFIGHVRGFYSLHAMAVLYLFLPMFHGAERVFRHILVPLTGQYEHMLLNDAYQIRRAMEQVIPAKDRDRVFANMASIFLKSKVQ